MTDIFQIFLQNLQNSSLIESIAVLFGILSVWFARKENILVFPTGIVSVLLYIFICIDVKLYADMGINAFYFLMSVYGWYNWTHKNGKSNEREISRTTKKEKVIIIIALSSFFLILYYILSQHTDSNVPIIDSITTSIFLVAMWLMARKKVENWSFWIIGDLISIPLYTYKGLVLTSFQFIIFLILAILGLIEWRRRINSNSENV
jgi:nicotinamide mononucleotide transporter